MATESVTEHPSIDAKHSPNICEVDPNICEGELLRFSDNDSCFCTRGCQREKVLSGWSRPCARTSELELEKKGKRCGENRKRAKQQRRNSHEREDDYTFRHYRDTKRYIEEYRYYHTRGDVGKEHKAVVFGVHVEDPYFPKLRTSVSQLFFDFSELKHWLPSYGRSKWSRRIFERMHVINTPHKVSTAGGISANNEDLSIMDRGDSGVEESTDDETVRLPNSPGDKKSPGPDINLAPVRADLNLPRILPCKTGQSDDEDSSSSKSNKKTAEKSKDTLYNQNLPRLGSLPIPVCVTHRRSGKGKAARGRVAGQSETTSHSTGSDAVSSVDSYKSGNSSNSAGQVSRLSIGNTWIPDGNSAFPQDTQKSKDPEVASTSSQREIASWEKRVSLESPQKGLERSKTYIEPSYYSKDSIRISYREEPSYKVWKDFTESTAYRDYLAKLYNLNSSRMKLKTAEEATGVRKQFRLCSENNKPKTRADRRVCCARCEEKKNSPDQGSVKPRIRPRVQLVLQSASKNDITSMPPLVRLNTMVRGYPYRTAEQHRQYMAQLTATQQKST